VLNIANEHKVPLFVIDQNVLRSVFQLPDPNAVAVHDHGSKTVPETSFFRSSLIESMSSHSSSFLTSHVVSARRCIHFCDVNRKVTHFATLTDFISTFHILKFVESLRRDQLVCIELAESSSEYSSLAASGYTSAKHLIIFDERRPKDESYLVHISIIDEIMTNYWYSEPLALNEHDKRLVHRQGIRKMNFQFDEHSQIYQKYVVDPNFQNHQH
jgi:hypothetical protein